MFVIIGKVGKPHGKKGYIRLIPVSKECDINKDFTSLCVLSKNGQKVSLVDIKKYTRGRFLAKLKGNYSREELKKFQGNLVASLS